MADADMPRHPGAAIRWVLGGIALFVFFLLAAETLNEGHYYKAAAWGAAFVVTFGLLLKWEWLFPHSAETERPHHDIRDIEFSAELVRIAPQPIQRDAWLQDGVCYALYGHWPADDETVFQEPDILERAGAVIKRMRELAHEGGMRIWGRTSPQSLHVPIQPDFWEHHQIALTSLWGPPETPHTEPTTHVRDMEYQALMVSRAQVERMWPAPTQAIAGIVPSLGKVVTRANQPLRDAARLAFEAIQGTESERIISGMNTTPEKRLMYFMADMMIQKLRHYGKIPPSSISVRIPDYEMRSLHPLQGQNWLIASYSNQPAYIDVTVDGEDLRAYLDNIKTRIP